MLNLQLELGPVMRERGGTVPDVPQVKILEAVKGLILAAGVAANVGQADIRSAASTLARQYGVAHHRQVEAEIARHLRNRG